MTTEGARAETLDLLGGALALDFANTAGGRGTRFAVDYLATPSDLHAWAVHAGLIGSPSTDASSRPSLADGQRSKAALESAKRLREAIYQCGTEIARGLQPSRTHLDQIRGFAAAAISSAHLVPSGTHVDFAFGASTVEEAILGPIALSAIDLLRTGRLDRVKQCPGDDCSWLFLDGSKNSSRRWCDMATCGNRHKGHRHRAKMHD